MSRRRCGRVEPVNNTAEFKWNSCHRVMELQSTTESDAENTAEYSSDTTDSWTTLLELSSSDQLLFASAEETAVWKQEAKMRIKRYKRIQKVLGFFETNYGFRKPYQVLIDGTLAQAALVAKVNLLDQLPKYFDSPVRLLTTPCIVIEAEQIGHEVYGGLQILKGYGAHKCKHSNKPKPAAACISSMVKPDNPNRYIVATQDEGLRERLREIPGVAILYLYGNAPTIEKPSDKSVQHVENKNQERVEVPGYQHEILSKLKEDVFGPSTAGPDRNFKKRKPKGGPNPLSCKKSKKSKTPMTMTPRTNSEVEETAKKKRKKIKVKIPKHVREEMSKSK